MAQGNLCVRLLFELLKELFAFSGSEEAIGLDPMLAGVEVVVAAAEGVEAFMRAPLYDGAGLNHEDLIRSLNCREPMRDDKRRAALHQITQALLDHRFRFGIERRSRLV